MYTFVVPDIHGKYEALRLLLREAGVIDRDGVRYGDENGRWDRVVSIGDLANATLNDVNGDEQCLLKARDWFDYLIMGNHESGYLFTDMSFNGYYPAPHLVSLYRHLKDDGFVVPAIMIGNTLLSHAGVHAYFNFEDADEAFDAIYDVWDNYREYELEGDWDNPEKFIFTYRGQRVEIPKSLLLNAVSNKRGGSTPFGGILWSDWDEAKNTNFSQVVGHSPRETGPIMTQYHGTGTFTLNLDCGAKQGLTPWGVWLDEEGQVVEFVTVEEGAGEQTPSSSAA